jgi:acetylornithine deacetylase/succinyl-diaminopimelate desuccinylase-like protein
MGGGPRVVMYAHLDTEFPAQTNVTTSISNGRLYAPGCGDDTRNVVALLASIRALNEAKVQTKGDLVFLFTVEE